MIEPEPKNAAAVVLGLGINGLALVRSLGMQGVDVVGVYVEHREFGRASRFCRSMRFPSLRDSEQEFLRHLVESLGDVEQRPILLAQSDDYVVFMSRNREILSRHFRFLLPNHDLVETLIRKDLSADFVTKKGLRVPKTLILGGRDGTEKVLAEIAYPCLVKAVDSFSVDLGEKTLTFPDSPSLRAFLNKRPELLGRLIAQQIIPGGDCNTFQATTYVCKGGTVLPIFTMRKIRQYPPNFGIVSYGVSETIPALVSKVTDFLTAIAYRGLISVEFKRDPSSGQWFYIESNLRLPYYHALIHDAGINYPLLYYRDMLGIEIDPASLDPQVDGIRWICFSNDSGSFARKYSRRQISIREWLLSIVKARSFAFYNRKDLRPFLHHTIDFVRQILERFAQRAKRLIVGPRNL